MPQIVIPLILFLFPLAYSPGPGNMFFAANGAKFGFWSTMPANIGYHLATGVVTVIVGFGFSAALENNQSVFNSFKIVGSLYVLWIAWKLFNAGVLDGEETAKPASFFDGIVLLLLNPKAYLIITLMFSQFLEHSDNEKVISILLISTVFTLNNFIAFSIWTAAGDTIASRFRSQAYAKKMNTVFAIVLAVVAVWMFFA